MPASVVAAIAADALATAVADAVIFDLVAATTFDWVASYSVLQAGTSFIAGSVLRGALSGGAEDAPTSTPSFTSAAQARTHVIRSSVANRTIVYGRVMVSGPLVFAASTTDNQTLHLVIALSGHEIESIDDIYFNDESIGTLDGNGNPTSGKYAGYCTVKKHLGAADQTADADLVAAGLGWTNDHRLRGVAYAYVKTIWQRDVFPRGIPNIKAIIKGKKLYDPRTGLTVWSDNWALACRDYLSGEYGIACDADEIDDIAVIAAANIADEDVPLAAGGTEKRYTCNGVLDTGNTPKANMQALLSGGAGTLTWPAGVYTLHAGAYTPPVMSLGADDLRGELNIQPRPSRQDLYNAVKGTYVSPDQYWQPVDFPALQNATYAAQDGGETIWRDLAFPVTTSVTTAQRLAKIALAKSRQGITVDAPCKLTAFKAAVWDTLGFSIPQLGWSDKDFKVTAWKFNETGGVDLTLQEEAAACYAWDAEETAVDPAPDTNLPNAFTVSAPGTPTVTESQFSTTGSAGVKARATMAWPASSDAFVVDYLPEYRPEGGAWTALPATTGLTPEINDIAPGSYEFRLRARNAVGASSAYSGTAAREIRGLTAPPSNPTNFSIVANGGKYDATWDLTADLDVKIGGRAVIRHSTKTSGAAWEDGIVVAEFAGSATSGPVPMMAGTYLIKFVDSADPPNWCATAASFVPSEALLTGWSTVATSAQHPAFAGSKSNTVANGGELYLLGAALIDDVGAIDGLDYIDALGGIVPSGSYTFDTYVDCGSAAARRWDATITAQSYDTGDLIDSRLAPIDEWDSIDGGTINDCDATLYIRTTADNPAGSPTWGAWTPFFVGDFNCRAAQFRLDLVSGNSSHNIKITALSARARIPA